MTSAQLVEVRRELVRAGWPRAIMAGSVTDERNAVEALYARLTELVEFDEGNLAVLRRLGPCARVSLPRAMYLAGLLDDDGARGPFPSSFHDWPVVEHPVDRGFPAPYAWRSTA